MPNLANVIKSLANAEGLSYWEYVKKNQGKKRFGFSYEKVDTAALLELEHQQKEARRKLKYNA